MAGGASRRDADVAALDGQAEEDEGEEGHDDAAGAGEPDCRIVLLCIGRE